MELFRWLVLCCVALFLGCSPAAAVTSAAEELRGAIDTLLQNSLDQTEAHLTSYDPPQLNQRSIGTLNSERAQAKKSGVSLVEWVLRPDDTYYRNRGTTKEEIAESVRKIREEASQIPRQDKKRPTNAKKARRAELIYLLQLREKERHEDALWLAERYLARMRSLNFGSQMKQDHLMALALAWAAYRDRSDPHEKVPRFDLIQEAAQTAVDRLSFDRLKERLSYRIDVRAILDAGATGQKDGDFDALLGHFRDALHELEHARPPFAATDPNARKTVLAAQQTLGEHGLATLLESADQQYRYHDNPDLDKRGFVNLVLKNSLDRIRGSSGFAGRADPTHARPKATRTYTSAGTSQGWASDAGPSAHHQNERGGIASGWPASVHGGRQPALGPVLEPFQQVSVAQGWQSATGMARSGFGGGPSAPSVFQRQGQQGGTIPRGSSGSVQAVGGSHLGDSNYAPYRQVHAQNAQAGPSTAGIPTLGPNQLRWSQAGYPPYGSYQQAAGFEPVSHPNEGWPRRDSHSSDEESGDGWYVNNAGKRVQYHHFL